MAAGSKRGERGTLELAEIVAEEHRVICGIGEDKIGEEGRVNNPDRYHPPHYVDPSAPPLTRQGIRMGFCPL